MIRTKKITAVDFNKLTLEDYPSEFYWLYKGNFFHIQRSPLQAHYCKEKPKEFISTAFNSRIGGILVPLVKKANNERLENSWKQKPYQVIKDLPESCSVHISNIFYKITREPLGVERIRKRKGISAKKQKYISTRSLHPQLKKRIKTLIQKYELDSIRDKNRRSWERWLKKGESIFPELATTDRPDVYLAFLVKYLNKLCKAKSYDETSWGYSIKDKWIESHRYLVTQHCLSQVSHYIDYELLHLNRDWTGTSQNKDNYRRTENFYAYTFDVAGFEFMFHSKTRLFSGDTKVVPGTMGKATPFDLPQGQLPLSLKRACDAIDFALEFL